MVSGIRHLCTSRVEVGSHDTVLQALIISAHAHDMLMRDAAIAENPRSLLIAVLGQVAISLISKVQS